MIIRVYYDGTDYIDYTDVESFMPDCNGFLQIRTYTGPEYWINIDKINGFSMTSEVEEDESRAY